MKFIETSEDLKESDFSEIEQDLKITLPSEFKEHYLKYNGGYPENSFYKWESGATTHINSFSSIRYEGFDSVEDSYKGLILQESYLPIGVMPFATDDAGNLFCLSCGENDFGYVYYCNNDNYNTETPDEYLQLLDKSFKHFIDNLSV